MKGFVSGLLYIAIGLSLVGCISIIESEHVRGTDADKIKGLRYSLPQPFLLMKPRADGGVDVEKVFLPDPKNQYAIRADAYFSTYTFTPTIADGLLTEIVIDTDNAGVATELIKTAGNLKKEQITAKAKQEEQKKKDAKEAADADKKKVDTAKDKVKELKDKLSIAKSKLAALQEIKNAGGPDAQFVSDEDLFNAKIAVVDLEAQIVVAESTLEETINETASFNIAGGGSAKSRSSPSPVLFRVDYGAGGAVKLVPVEYPKLVGAVEGDDSVKIQNKLFTSKLPPKAPPSPVTPRLTLAGLPVITKDGQNPPQLTVNVNRTIFELKKEKVKLKQGGSDVSSTYLTLPPVLRNQRKSILIGFEKKIPPGKYSLTVTANFGTKKKPDRGTETFLIEIQNPQEDKPRLSIKGFPVVEKSNDRLQLTLESNLEILKVEGITLTDVATSKDVTSKYPPTWALQSAPKTINIEFPIDVPSNRYKLHIKSIFETLDSPKPSEFTFEIEIRNPPNAQ